MSIENVEQAREYLDKVGEHLKALTKLSIDAGMHRQAAIWLTLHGAFLHSPEEVKTIEDMIGMYLEHSVNRY